MNRIGFWTLLKREVLRFLSLPNQTILPAMIQMALHIAIFGYFLGGRIQTMDGHSYIHFIFPGLLMIGVTNAAFANSATSLFISRWERFIEDLLIAPLSYLEMVVALILASVARGVVNGISVLILGLILIRSPFEHPFLLLLALIFSSMVFSAFGLIVGLWADRWDDIAVMQNYIVTPLTFLGGVFYSTTVLPEKVQWVNEFNPIYYMVATARYSILGSSEAPIALSMGVTALLAVALTAWAVELFRRGYKLRT